MDKLHMKQAGILDIEATGRPKATSAVSFLLELFSKLEDETVLDLSLVVGSSYLELSQRCSYEEAY